ncbi:hypothetical protein GP486_003349 [Trichoglossum hirsutum]|uniref:Auxin efflux carrier n=1 Tax=Trichoglossum hirsutum TaxID=265104 RepID=A0A9P8RQT7_9PEZI|nr:hypothetical protein GP486_003349 [Trichoglossum hirsutum]
MFDAESQKFVANLNVALFTPCLIFTKLASQLTLSKLVELAVIPVIFAIQTLVSYLCSAGISRAFRLGKRPRNFVVAMGVFGNSNSLPISLVISLSQTLKGLHWDKVPGDNDDEVAARGILYLLIFQQLGQLVRWSWGYHVLLAPPEKYDETPNHVNSQVERGRIGYTDADEFGEYEDASASPTSDETQSLLNNSSKDDSIRDVRKGDIGRADGDFSRTESLFESGGQTPVTPFRYPSSATSSAPESREGSIHSALPPSLLTTPAVANVLPANTSNGNITSFPSIRSPTPAREQSDQTLLKRWIYCVRATVSSALRAAIGSISALLSRISSWVPKPMWRVLSKLKSLAHRFLIGLWEFMNPPLWAMLAAIIVASIPSLQRLLFTEGTFLSNSATRAISQSGGVAIPLILVVLGANLARNTLPSDPHRTVEHEKEETKLLIASLVSRMLLPIVIMAPILALGAKYVPISILDDPIFVIVCFLLTGAPSALQLAQICQINGVYEGVMSRLLFQSYVIWILPSTLILVMCALEVVEWAQVG